MHAITAILLAAAPGAPALALPIACQPGRDCWVQKYPDLAAGPDRKDYRCGPITTDAHDGTDFRIASLDRMRRGVAVLAAAAGTVLRVRDGEPELSVKERGATGKEAGNGVVIDHGGGWETQYSHLRQGSVRVRPGQKVEAGAPIGLVGLSGNTEYPHLHFAVRHAGTRIDPFGGTPVPGMCGAGQGRSLWSAASMARLPYSPGQVVRVDLTSVPQPVPISADPPRPGRRSALIAVADVIAPQAGDAYRFEILGPAKQRVLQREGVVERPYLSWGPYAGVKPPVEGWKPGQYSGAFILIRNGREVSRATTVATIE